MSKLFIVDDDPFTCDLLEAIAKPLFLNIETFQSSRLFSNVKINDDDIILLDLMMPNMDGIEVIRFLAKSNATATLVLISGYDRGVLHSAEALAQDHGLRVAKHFTKPIPTTELISLLSTLFDQNINNEVKLPGKVKPNSATFIPDKDDLQQALKNNQFIINFQPQILMKTADIFGAEVLVRWQHPEHGLISPDKFIPLAERSGQMGQLTEEIIYLAIEQSMKWQNMGKATKLSINISAQNITSLQLPEQLKKLVKLHHLDPAMFMLEVTESTLMNNITTSLDILTRLRLKGFQLSIDDFGTGFSSLSQLHKIPFTELKIDQSFVSNMLDDHDSRAIVETCIMLGHKLNMNVVAEGIENQATWDILLEAGCDIAQGYFIAKPMSASEFTDWEYGNTSSR